MDRFDICCAHALLEWGYNVGGWLRERPSNLRRREATAVQLLRLNFKPPFDLSLETLSDDGKLVYLTNVLRWGLPRDAEVNALIKETYARDWLQTHFPSVHDEMYSGPASAP